MLSPAEDLVAAFGQTTIDEGSLESIGIAGLEGRRYHTRCRTPCGSPTGIAADLAVDRAHSGAHRTTGNATLYPLLGGIGCNVALVSGLSGQFDTLVDIALCRGLALALQRSVWIEDRPFGGTPDTA